MCPLSGRESDGARPCDATISRHQYRHRITTASSRIRPELASPAGLTATCAGLHAVGGRCAGSDCIGDQATGPAYFSLSHKRRASIGAGLALEIMVYAAEFPLPAA